jgi:alpha,alpha-trehalase
MNFLLFAIIFGCFLTKVLLQSEPSCDSKIYCQGKLLDYVQMSQIFEDSKTFVDMSMKKSEEEILQDFDQLLQESDENPSEDQIRQFVDEHFEKSHELQDWTPPDYKDNPKFLSEIQDEEMRDYAQNLVKIWPTLTRKVKDEVKNSPETFSLIPGENGFVVPGGRFEEFYYWDTYWIIRGLLLGRCTTLLEVCWRIFVNGQEIWFHTERITSLLPKQIPTSSAHFDGPPLL